MDVCSFCGCRLRLGYLTDRAVFVILTPRFLRFAVPVCVLQVGFVSAIGGVEHIDLVFRIL